MCMCVSVSVSVWHHIVRGLCLAVHVRQIYVSGCLPGAFAVTHCCVTHSLFSFSLRLPLLRLVHDSDVPIKLPMTDRQSTLYENIISKHLLHKSKFNTAAAATTEAEAAALLVPAMPRSRASASASSGLSVNLSASEATNIFTDLRKASNHPLLLRTHFHSDEVLHRIAAVCCSVLHFGDACDHQRAYQELLQFSDFDLNFLCLEYPSFLGHLQLPSSVLYDSPKMVRLKTLLPTLIVSEAGRQGGREACISVYVYICIYVCKCACVLGRVISLVTTSVGVMP